MVLRVILSIAKTMVHVDLHPGATDHIAVVLLGIMVNFVKILNVIDIVYTVTAGWRMAIHCALALWASKVINANMMIASCTVFMVLVYIQLMDHFVHVNQDTLANSVMNQPQQAIHVILILAKMEANAFC